jgi:hypothetical protein
MQVDSTPAVATIEPPPGPSTLTPAAALMPEMAAASSAASSSAAFFEAAASAPQTAFAAAPSIVATAAWAAEGVVTTTSSSFDFGLQAQEQKDQQAMDVDGFALDNAFMETLVDPASLSLTANLQMPQTQWAPPFGMESFQKEGGNP